MSEHDAPTVARATVWLDTSNDAPTRPSDRLDGHETEPSSALVPLDELETTHYRPLDIASGEAVRTFEAPALAQTETLEQALSIEQRIVRAARRRGYAGRWLVACGCASALATAFMIGQATPRWTRSEPRAERARPAHATESSAPRATPAERAPRAQTDGDPALDADAPSAVHALARGDYDRALALYRALEREHPNHAAFATIVRLLAARAGPRCRPGEGGARCGG